MPSRPIHDSNPWVEFEPRNLASDWSQGDLVPTFDLEADDPLPFDLQTLNGAPGVGPRQAPKLPPADMVPGTTVGGATQTGSIWLDGDVLMCACPDCRAPMSIRLWLMVADCWNCGTSIELSEEQQREAERLMRRRETEIQDRRKERVTPQPAAARPTPASRGPVAQKSARRPESPSRPPALPTNGHAAPPRPTAPVRPARPAAPTYQRRPFQSWLADTPAWLISLVVHLIFITLLGLFTFGTPEEPRFITLSTSVSREVVEGDNTQPMDPSHELAFDLPLPKDTNLEDSEVRDALIRADQDAKELRLAEDAASPFLPNVEHVKDKLRSSDFSDRTLAARDPRIRTVLVTQEGGTTLTEAAVARGLRWLAKQQKADGRWVLDGGLKSDPAATALALLPFLGAGQTHLTGKYQKEVAGGLRWLLEHQRENGDLAAGSAGNSHMYAHGQAAIVLCEAFATTGDEQLRIPAQKAIDFIVQAQHPAGGWRYQPGQAGDTSVLGWQLMALQSARAANLTVPPATLENASHFLDSVSSHDGSRYAYVKGQGPTEVMTAEALLCRMYLGWTLSDYGLSQGVDWLAENHLPSDRQTNLYYWYYGTQVFHHVGGENWEKWNVRIRDILVNSQEKRGDLAGSWAPQHHHDRPGGRIYATAIAVCTLEVYYRHVPIFRQIDLD